MSGEHGIRHKQSLKLRWQTVRQEEARNHSSGKQEVEHGAEDKARSVGSLSTEKVS